ncbi:MAG: LamG-like jellyroll fold domain-containing protein [Planctomycetia bacterium]|nr:LamG-like jellyroll fold domain-containing protein [Planctomycetia bacterium]
MNHFHFSFSVFISHCLTLFLTDYFVMPTWASVEKRHLRFYASFDDSCVPEIALDGAKLHPKRDIKETLEGKMGAEMDADARNIPVVDGKSGGALHFDPNVKTDDLIYETGTILAGNEWSIAFWLKLDEAGNAQYGQNARSRGLFRTNFGWQDGNVYAVFNTWGALELVHFDGDKKNSGFSMPSSGFRADRWMHLVFTYRDGHHALFINGNEGAYSRNMPCGAAPAPSRHLRLGSMDYRAGDLLDGAIDELKLFNCALNADEIRSIMNTTPGKKPDRCLYLPLDGEISGSGFQTFNAANLIYADGKSGKGVKISRHGYDRYATLTLHDVKTSPRAVSLIFDFIPDWDGFRRERNAENSPGLFHFQSTDVSYDLTVKNEKLTFTLTTQNMTQTVSLPVSVFRKGKLHRVCAGFDCEKGKIFVSVNERIEEKAFSALRNKIANKTGNNAENNAEEEISGTVSLGNAPGTNTYSATQAEGVLDEVLLLNGYHTPEKLEKRQAREIRLNAGSRKAPIDVAPVTEQECGLWELDGAERVRTATRERITLNALWRMQLTDAQRPFNPEDWIYLAVPGRYSGQANGMTDAEFFMRDKNLKKLDKNAQYDGRSPYVFVNGWFERGFQADSAWKNREIVLQIQELSASQTGTIYLNGQPLAELARGSMFEIPISPDLLRFGHDEWNYLTIHTIDSGQMWAWRGIKGDVALEIRNPIYAEFPQIITSVREKKAACDVTLVNRSNTEKTVCAEFTIAGENAPKPVRSASVTLAPGTSETVRAEIPWENALLWSPETPNLYTCTVRVISGDENEGEKGKSDGESVEESDRENVGESDGKNAKNVEKSPCLDELPPFRFGFRELEIRGRDFYLNGRKIHLFTHDAWSNTTTDLEEARRVARTLKRLGYNSIRTNFSSKDENVDTIMRVCDEEGLMQLVGAEGVTSSEYVLWNDAEMRENLEKRMASLVRRWRNHPSNVIWFLSVNFLGYGWDYHPLKMADGYLPEHIMPKYRVCAQGVDILCRYDTSRPFFFQAGGEFGEIHTTNAYFCWWPQQERNAWPAEWQRVGTKPLHIIETSFPYFRSFYGMDTHKNGPRPLFMIENLARYYGPEVYENPSTDALRQTELSTSGKEAVIWTDMPEFQRLKCDLLLETIPFWRSFDLSGLCPFAEIQYAMEKNAPYHTQYNPKSWSVSPGDFRRFGWHPDLRKISYQADIAHEKPLPTYFALQKSLAPRLVFIDGGKADPVDQSMNYTSGTQLKKRVVLINDTLENTTFTGRWKLGRKFRRFSETLQPGEIRYVPITITVPEVTEITQLKLAVELDSATENDVEIENDPETEREKTYVQEPRIVTVYPKLNVEKVTGNTPITLYDPVGKTAEKLREIGVPFTLLETDGTLAENDEENEPETPFTGGLLIVGTEALTPEFLTFSAKIHLAELLESGRVELLVMAQKPEALATVGMRAKPIYAAKVFDVDGKVYGPWRGKSTLPPEKPLPAENTQEGVASPLWHWVNTNIVTSYPILRPSEGRNRILLSCGKDLLYSPLLEMRVGRGSVTFCQLEIENRTEADPQANAFLNSFLTEILARHTAQEIVKKRESKTEKVTLGNVSDAEKYGLKTKTEAVRIFQFTPEGERYFPDFSARDRFFRTPVEMMTFWKTENAENVEKAKKTEVIPLTDPPFVVEIRVKTEKNTESEDDEKSEKIIFLGLPDEMPFGAEKERGLKNGHDSSEILSVEMQENRLRQIHTRVLEACGMENRGETRTEIPSETPSIAPYFEGKRVENETFPYTFNQSKYDTEKHVRW